MDFELDGDLESVRELAAQIFGALAKVDRVADVENRERGFDRTLWRALGDAGLLAIALPEELGGGGMGTLGLVALLEEQGRHVAPVPLWSALAGAALPIARFGTAAQTSRWLPGLIDGSSLLVGVPEVADAGGPALSAVRQGESLIVDGQLTGVPAAAVADGLVVPVRCEDDSTVFVIVHVDAIGVGVTSVDVTSRESSATVRFEGVEVPPDGLLPGEGSEILEWTRRRARVALSALQSGVCEEAVRRTAAYTSERIQFGRPLSTNQAVAVRAADAYLDTEAIRLTTRRAAWLLDSGRESEAESASLVAEWWASSGGLRVVHASQHLHGGIGADVDYPIHRYFLWGRQIAFTLGSAAAVAAELGDRLDTAPAVGSPA